MERHRYSLPAIRARKGLYWPPAWVPVWLRSTWVHLHLPCVYQEIPVAGYAPGVMFELPRLSVEEAKRGAEKYRGCTFNMYTGEVNYPDLPSK